MLIRFRAENIFSFKEQIEFSMIPSLERIHAHQVFRTKKRSDVNLTRFAALYGANAAGKSNLVKVLRFAQNMIVHGLKPEAQIPIQRFRLSQDCLHRPAKFEIEFKVGTDMYEYGFELDPKYIHSEWLKKITRRSERLIFHRTTNETGDANLKFGEFIKKIVMKINYFFILLLKVLAQISFFYTKVLKEMLFISGLLIIGSEKFLLLLNQCLSIFQ